MKKREISDELGMEEYVWGEASILFPEGLDLSVEKNRFQVLDEICASEDYTPLGDKWRSFSFSDCSELLLNAIEFDIAYSSTRITPPEIAQKFHQTLLEGFQENNTYCYSNRSSNHWKSKNGGGWNPLTPHTFDISIVFINQEKILFCCFISED